MTIQEAQRDFRSVFMGGAVGQFVSGFIWLLSAALTTWVNPTVGVFALVIWRTAPT